VESQEQLELFTDEFSRQKRVEETVFRLQRKMGDVTLTKASLMKGGGKGKPENPRGA
jgi:hypothetical protein